MVVHAQIIFGDEKCPFMNGDGQVFCTTNFCRNDFVQLSLETNTGDPVWVHFMRDSRGCIVSFGFYRRLRDAERTQRAD